jgi:type II secretory ATPase GspE/PulE/Tfp pilus assembly ATPase PilB-like protein
VNKAESKRVATGLQVIADGPALAAYLSKAAHGGDVWTDSIWRADVETIHDQTGIPLAQLQTCERLSVPVLLPEAMAAEADALALMSPEQARERRALPLRIEDGLVAVAMEDPIDGVNLTALDFLSRHRIAPLLAPRRALKEALSRYYDRVEDARIARELGLDPAHLNRVTEPDDAERLARQKPIVRLVTELISEAVRRRASDVHVRPTVEGADLLFRIDDELVPVRQVQRALVPALISRIKVLASMNLAEHRKPQDGRSSFTLDDGRSIDLRMSVMPAVFGESMVVRLLDTEESLKSLDQIGFTADDAQRLDDLMNRSHGMFLATGPTGCGKSTTLYAMLLELRKQRINILTIEDPVEFYIEDIQQMQVNRAADFTFANAMRNFLRHDPDVIMVGEIRDRETADIAVESALTGHLLLSTLHTNTAATTIARLLDLGVEAFLLRSSLLAVLAQRLVRLNCPHCAVPESPSAHIRELLGVGPEESFSIGAGCPHCEGLGVFKRAAVYELLEVTPEIRQLIVPGAEADRIHAQALAQGMTSLTQSAVAMARAGRISLTEAYRVRAD